MMGSPHEVAELLRTIDRGSWAPVIDSVRPLAEAGGDARANRVRCSLREARGRDRLTDVDGPDEIRPLIGYRWPNDVRPVDGMERDPRSTYDLEH
jgi:hypothetical protein